MRMHTYSANCVFRAALTGLLLCVFGLGLTTARAAVGDPPYASVDLGTAIFPPSNESWVDINAFGEAIVYDPEGPGAGYLQLWVPSPSNSAIGGYTNLTSVLATLPVTSSYLAMYYNAVSFNDFGEMAIVVQDKSTNKGAFAVLTPSIANANTFADYSAKLLTKAAVDEYGDPSLELNNYGELLVDSDQTAPLTLESPTVANGLIFRQALIANPSTTNMSSVNAASLNAFGEVAYGGYDTSDVFRAFLWNPTTAHSNAGSATELTSSFPNNLKYLYFVQLNDFGQMLFRYEDASDNNHISLWTPTKAHAAAGTFVSYDSYVPTGTLPSAVQINDFGQVLVSSFDEFDNSYATLITPTAANGMIVKKAQPIAFTGTKTTLESAQLSADGAVLLLGYNSTANVREVSMWAPVGPNKSTGTTYSVSAKATPALPTDLSSGSINGFDTLLLTNQFDQDFYLVANSQ